uniref:Uncharacterized protein n=1 Tax=Ditylenchus dipsaci TaxID=166011 RepID=A0A915DDN4_9BILA
MKLKNELSKRGRKPPLTQEMQDAKKQATDEVKLPVDQNGNPINIANYMDEKYEQPAAGDSDVNCLNRLFDCNKPEMLATCAGTCSREINNQNTDKTVILWLICATMQYMQI